MMLSRDFFFSFLTFKIMLDVSSLLYWWQDDYYMNIAKDIICHICIQVAIHIMLFLSIYNILNFLQTPLCFCNRRGLFCSLFGFQVRSMWPKTIANKLLKKWAHMWQSFGASVWQENRWFVCSRCISWFNESWSWRWIGNIFSNWSWRYSFEVHKWPGHWWGREHLFYW